MFSIKNLIFFFLIFLNASFKSINAHEIYKDYCNPELYTAEVTDVKCSNRAIEFKSKGFPAASHIIMEGIAVTNQQIPQTHSYQFFITKNPEVSARKTIPDSGPIGVAINGIPLFDPATQGPVNPATGKRPSSYPEELDKCGGHAGRGDDYHYHIAPVCLIEDLGPNHIEISKKPVGFSMDGFPILALGWFDPQNSVEKQLDDCRGMLDETGEYFYNVKNTADYDILSCFHATPQNFAKDEYKMRKDKKNNDIVGDPIKFEIKTFATNFINDFKCDRMSGTLSKESLLQTNGTVDKINQQNGDIFYCNSGCYGMFFEADKKPEFKGRVMYYEKVINNCPSGFLDNEKNDFVAYEGPEQTPKAPQSTKK